MELATDDRVPAVEGTPVANVWTKEVPTEQGLYWNWDGSRDSSPLPFFVMWSGTTRTCFVSRGQLGIREAVDCDKFGGWWCPVQKYPPLPRE